MKRNAGWLLVAIVILALSSLLFQPSHAESPREVVGTGVAFKNSGGVTAVAMSQNYGASAEVAQPFSLVADPTVSVSDTTTPEGNQAVFTITLSGPSQQVVTVRVKTESGTATGDVDYNQINSFLDVVFAPDTTSQMVSIPTFQDPDAEPDETFNLTVLQTTNATVADGLGVGTIIDNDGPPPTVSVSDTTTPEGNQAVFTITLSGPSQQVVTVRVKTESGTATGDVDYNQINSFLDVVFATNITTQMVSIPTFQDPDAEPDETFNLTVLQTTNATVADGLGVGTIIDNDGPPPTVSVSDTTTPEGNQAVFTITLSGPSQQVVTVRVKTESGTATGDVDYNQINTFLDLVFATNITTQMVSIPTFQDAEEETNETFNLTVLQTTNATVADGLGVGTIIDDDAQPPTITCPVDQTVTGAPGTGEAMVNYPLPTASDNNPGVTVACNPASGSFFQPGTTAVSCMATDAVGNTATCSFKVTVTCDQDASLNNSSPLMISRFRENGPGGATDEFVEIFNPTTTAHRVASGTCTGGYGVFASAGNGTASNSATMVCQIANGTVIPAGGYYLCAGTGYTLGNLGRNGGTAGATATGDSAIGCGGLIGGCAGDIPNDAGLALINIGTNVVINTAGGFAVSGVPASAVIVYDKVGFGPYGPGAPGSAYPSLAGNFCEGGACLRPVGDASLLGTCTDPSGAGLFPVVAAAPACYGQSGQYGLLRRQTIFDGSLGTLHRDSNDNGDDFMFVSPNPGSNTGLTITGVSGVTAVLGAAGPYNLSAPPDASLTRLDRQPFDGVDQLGPRNAERSYVQDPNVANPLNDPLGTFTLRFKYRTGVAINGLRFEVDNLSTLCGPQTASAGVGTGEARNLAALPACGVASETAILKVLNSFAEVLVDSGGIAQMVNGTVMEDLSASATPTPLGRGPLSPLGGGIDNRLVVNPSTAAGSVGDGVTGGTGNFGTTMGASGPTSILRLKVKLGVVRSGRFVLLFITSATP